MHEPADWERTVYTETTVKDVLETDRDCLTSRKVTLPVLEALVQKALQDVVELKHTLEIIVSPVWNTGGWKGLANFNMTKTCKEIFVFSNDSKCQQERMKRRNAMVKNTLRVSLQGLVVFTDAEAEQVQTRNQRKTHLK